jgi:hypothetical protein
MFMGIHMHQLYTFKHGTLGTSYKHGNLQSTLASQSIHANKSIDTNLMTEVREEVQLALLKNGVLILNSM